MKRIRYLSNVCDEEEFGIRQNNCLVAFMHLDLLLHKLFALPVNKSVGHLAVFVDLDLPLYGLRNPLRVDEALAWCDRPIYPPSYQPLRIGDDGLLFVIN